MLTIIDLCSVWFGEVDARIAAKHSIQSYMIASEEPMVDN